MRQANGNIVVADRGEFRVSVFDSAGHLLGRSGQRGDGPGDFRQIWTIWPLAGDSIGVYDIALQRVSILGPDGRFVRAWPRMDNLFGAHLFVDGAFAGGSVLGELRIAGPPPRESTIQGRDEWLVRVALDGRTLDTVGRFFGRESLVYVNGGRVMGGSAVPFGRFGFATARGDTAFYLDGADSSVARFSSSGETIDPLAVGDLARAPTDSERKVALAQFLDGTPGMPESLREALATALENAKDRRPPLFDSLLVDRTGRVWVRRARRLPDGVREWFLRTPDGKQTSRLKVPASWRLLETGVDYLLVADTERNGRAAHREVHAARRRVTARAHGLADATTVERLTSSPRSRARSPRWRSSPRVTL